MGKSMFRATKKQTNYLSSNELIKKAMLKRRRLARASILKIQGIDVRISLVK